MLTGIHLQHSRGEREREREREREKKEAISKTG